MVRGLDEGESEFLEDVSNRQVELEKKKLQEEKEFVQALKISLFNRICLM